MAKEKFSLADAMRGAIGDASVASMGASNSDTAGREQIEYIYVDQLVADEKNFYSLEGIEELAANIELVGLQQPLRVRSVPDTPDFKIVSGHRRFAALTLLIDEGKQQFSKIPCIVERDDVSPALQELRLIYANSDTRKMNDADLAKQAERVTELLYRLKEEGIEFPGRMRDHVAEACKISATKLATLKVIREKLPEQYRAEFESGKMSTDAAYKLAKAPTALQDRICRVFKTAPEANKVDRLLNVHKERKGCLWVPAPALKCPDGSGCSHGDAFLRHDATCYVDETCGGKTCCLKCDRATRDWSPCGSACSKAKQLRAEKYKDKKAQEEKESARQQKKYRREISAVMNRLLPLVDAAGLGDKVSLASRYQDLTVKKLRDYAAGEFVDKPFYGNNYDLKYYQGDTLIRLAQQLHCTVDFLLGLTDDPTPADTEAVSKSDTAPQWRTGEPEKDGSYWCQFESDNTTITINAYYSTVLRRWEHKNGVGIERDGIKCLRWYPLPEEDA